MPIEVQAERPASTAVTEQPLPRCATTSARSEDGVSSSSAARDVAHSTDSPWKPNRRRPCRSIHAVGQRIGERGGGSVAWNAVSKAAASGTPGSATSAARIVSTATGLWSGARSASPSSSSSTSSSTSVGAVNRVPPWTTR